MESQFNNFQDLLIKEEEDKQMQFDEEEPIPMTISQKMKIKREARKNKLISKGKIILPPSQIPLQMPKDQVQRMKNRAAAQKSREVKKEYVSHLFEENNRLREQMKRLKMCPQCRELNYLDGDLQTETRSRQLEFQENHHVHQTVIMAAQIIPSMNSDIIFPSVSTDQSDSSSGNYQRLSRKDQQINFISSFLFICLIAACVIAPSLTGKKSNQNTYDEQNIVRLMTSIPSTTYEYNVSQIEAKTTSLTQSRQIGLSNISSIIQTDDKCYDTLVKIENGSQQYNNSNKHNRSILYCRQSLRIFYGKQNGNEGYYYQMLMSGLQLIEMLGENCQLPSGGLLEPERMYILRSKILTINPFNCESSQ